jgi:hypothetical protein
MDAELRVPLTMLALFGLAAWTAWSLDAGRRIARWGRRKLRRLALVILLLGVAAAALAA